MTAATQDEETLDCDFFQFLSVSKTYYQKIINDKDKYLCRQWLEKLCGERVKGRSKKRNRNILLSQLIMDMKEGKLSKRFLNPPTNDPLPLTNSIFGIHDPETDFLEENDNVEFEDFQERSADGRTYVAIRCLPDSQGTYAFVALNIDKEEEESDDKIIIPCSIDKSELQHLKAMRKLQKACSTLCDHPSESQIEDFYIRNIDAKVFGNISKLQKKPRCSRDKKEIDFIDLLLKKIDEEMKGATSGDNRLVEFLLYKLTEDLKWMPKMKHIFELKPEQRRLKVLQILRQKLIVRQQEEKKVNIIADMEERMLASAVQPECCMGEVEEPAESMWQLMITKPLNETDQKKLTDIYPQEIISTFLDLLAGDRHTILKRGRKRQNKMLESMRSEIYKEINSGKAEYNKARKTYREWNEILSMVEETLYEARVQEKEQVDEQAKLKSMPDKNKELLDEMITNIMETENLIKEEARQGEELTEEIAATNAWSCSIKENKDEGMWEMKEMIDNLKEQIELFRIMIKKQIQRINELRQRLDYD